MALDRWRGRASLGGEDCLWGRAALDREASHEQAESTQLFQQGPSGEGEARRMKPGRLVDPPFGMLTDLGVICRCTVQQ